MRKPALSFDRVKRTFSSRETFLSYTIYKPNLKDITPFPLCTKHPGKSDWRKIEVWLDVWNSQAQKDSPLPSINSGLYSFFLPLV